jgi:threonine dehydrogenase-like Zn-dependent dehydrogenase
LTCGARTTWTWSPWTERPLPAAAPAEALLALRTLDERTDVRHHAAHYHELTLRGSYHHTPAAIREALALLAGGAYPFAELLTHTYPLERVAEPLAQAAGLAEPDSRLLKAVIQP